MDLVGFFAIGLFTAVEKIWEKVFDAAWDPIDAELKDRFSHWAGKGSKSERRNAFASASEKARRRTIRQSSNPEQAEMILKVLDRDTDQNSANALAEETAKILLFAEQPNLDQMIEICRRQLRWEGVLRNKPAPSEEMIAQVLSRYLENLRLALTDENPYRELIQHEMLRALQRTLQNSADNTRYDGESEYLAQLIERFQYLDFVGIPELKDRQSLRVEDLFVHLQAEIG